MTIRNYWKDLGDDFDGAVITLSEPAFNAFHKVFTHISLEQLRQMGLTSEEIEIVRKFAHLY